LFSSKQEDRTPAITSLRIYKEYQHVYVCMCVWDESLHSFRLDVNR